MSRMLFVNLPVDDLARSMEFFTGLGFTFNPEFTNEKAAAMVIGDGAFVMLLHRDFFAGFTTRAVADDSVTECINAISATSRDDVDRLVATAFQLGGRPAKPRTNDGPMYGWSFLDIDGHHWEVIYMDPSAFAAA